ncbi:TetR/AcrR family transcriptional regulator [Microbacterium jejuense]|uniref:TetR/AcrR family transcriptional regulator n=1 Tax=Microbacterium jejuense TaxID=1263637 RepID=A0ABS7HPA2_9MICO|nr:TetR/AcrR family transcriptional regulator [Microbacterium jejuense]MBW9094259.1 TetR/AcrR family transcriptional regulator [Microbacterium jejuense]
MDLEQPAKRRRGQELEEAILAAGWAQLMEGGYHAFTIDAVAERAETSRSVIYRRWPDRDALMDATLAYGLNKDRVDPPDTGSLRGDIIESLKRSNLSRAGIAPLMSVFMGAYYADSGRTFADVRERALGQRAAGSLDVILERAIARGEADPAKLTPRVRSVAVDLYRHDLLMTAAPLPDEAIEAIVDEVFLPLVRPDAR